MEEVLHQQVVGQEEAITAKPARCAAAAQGFPTPIAPAVLSCFWDLRAWVNRAVQSLGEFPL